MLKIKRYKNLNKRQGSSFQYLTRVFDFKILSHEEEAK